MECVQDEQGEFVVLRLEGNMRTEDDYMVFKDTIDEILEKEKKKIIINLQKVAFINSAGLGRLILTAKRCGKLGGTLRAVGLSEEMHELFTMTRLVETIKVYDDEQQAVGD